VRFPDLFAAAGVHSGRPTGAANDVVSAFAAMRGETAAHGLGRGARGPDRARRLIVMHGDADATVAAVNAERLYAEARAALSPAAAETRRIVAAEGRRSAAGRRVEGPGGRAELWRIAGAGHAWAGGDPAGSWTDPQGPDASAEMVRFFLEED
jgi:poly(3-hydroxybutyrate) depolymerase